MYLASPSVGEDTDAGRLGTPPGELADQPERPQERPLPA